MARADAGRRIADVEYDHRAIDVLVRLHQLPDTTVHDQAAINTALTVLMDEVIALLDENAIIAAMLDDARTGNVSF